MKLIAPRIEAAPARCSARMPKSSAGPGWPTVDERRIDRPAAAEAERARRAFEEEGGDEEAEARDREPEGDVVHARERHVGRADHEGHEPVAETADQGRHHHEEDHDEAVAGDEDVVSSAGSRRSAGRAAEARDACRSTGRRRRDPRRTRRSGRACRCPCGSSSRTSAARRSGRRECSAWAASAACAMLVDLYGLEFLILLRGGEPGRAGAVDGGIFLLRLREPGSRTAPRSRHGW